MARVPKVAREIISTGTRRISEIKRRSMQRIALRKGSGFKRRGLFYFIILVLTLIISGKWCLRKSRTSLFIYIIFSLYFNCYRKIVVDDNKSWHAQIHKLLFGRIMARGFEKVRHPCYRLCRCI